VTRGTTHHFDGTTEDFYAIREAYTGSGGGVSWTAEEAFPHGETVAELRADFELMQRAFDEPVLDLRDDADQN
jgi:hypothetical protein